VAQEFASVAGQRDVGKLGAVEEVAQVVAQPAFGDLELELFKTQKLTLVGIQLFVQNHQHYIYISATGKLGALKKLFFPI
jgi:hypothetical protein